MIWFTADEHYGHENIIEYCNRPFENVDEMDSELIRRHNEVVKEMDLVYHLGDFSLIPSKSTVAGFASQLNGEHVFIRGSHDRWMDDGPEEYFPEILELSKKQAGHPITLCHYAMKVWPRSHYNSWQLFGHSHGRLPVEGKQYDVGVDNNDFYPISLEQIKVVMNQQPDNFNCLSNFRGQ